MKKITTAINATLFALALALGGNSANAATFPEVCAASGGTFNASSGLCQYGGTTKTAGYGQWVVLFPGDTVIFPDGTRAFNAAHNCCILFVRADPK